MPGDWLSVGGAAKAYRAWLTGAVMLAVAGALAWYLCLHPPTTGGPASWAITFEVPPVFHPAPPMPFKERVLAFGVPREDQGRATELVAMIYIQPVRVERALDFNAAFIQCLRNVSNDAGLIRDARAAPRRTWDHDALEGQELRVEREVVLLARACFTHPNLAYVFVMLAAPRAADDVEIEFDALTRSIRRRGEERPE